MQIDIVKLKAQILCGAELAMGPGKADLLEAIDREKSISGAGRALGMSYRRTWLLVDTMNRCWRDKPVETLAGGAKGRGAHLTPAGRALLKAYRAMEADIARLIERKHLDGLQSLLRDSPLEMRTGMDNAI